MKTLFSSSMLVGDFLSTANCIISKEGTHYYFIRGYFKICGNYVEEVGCHDLPDDVKEWLCQAGFEKPDDEA